MMTTKKTIIFIALLFVIGLSTNLFIKKSNDHIECETIVKKELDKNGN